MSSGRSLSMRRLAARVARHERIKQLIREAVEAAFAGWEKGLLDELPRTMEEVADDMTDNEHKRLWLRREAKIPPDYRRQRDDAIRRMLAGGLSPSAISDEVRCSLAHVYKIRREWKESNQTGEDSAARSKSPA